ncbi:hypothetical protein ACODT5_04715 [Streptomyces sp. 5.8]|uniref:hypothetical protein n=1 Tax=Streptomyces sp. 5.8 TaxID=3406571 RepID=UPI003BB556C0
MKKIYEDSTGRGTPAEPVLTAEDLARPTPPPPRMPSSSAAAAAAAAVAVAADGPAGGPASDRESGDEAEPLLGAAEAERYHSTWSEIQGRFVDDPQEAVRAADALVSEVMLKFSDSLSARRDGLEEQWNRGDRPATEDLRQALRAYRTLVDRLLAT